MECSSYKKKIHSHPKPDASGYADVILHPMLIEPTLDVTSIRHESQPIRSTKK
jgi:hypothetical protein